MSPALEFSSTASFSALTITVTNQGVVNNMLTSFSQSRYTSRRLRVAHGCAVFIAALAASSCESGGGIGPVKDTPVISDLSATKSSVDVTFGANASVAFTISRGGGYSGPVSFSVDGLPAGVVGTFTPASLDKSSTTSTLVLSASQSAAAAVVPLTIRVTGEGVASKTLPLVLNIIVPNITATVGTGTLSAAIEAPLTVPVTITRSGILTDVVTLSVLNLPTGLTASFSRPELDPATSTTTLTLTPAPGTPLGVRNLILHASSIDVVKDIPFSVTILDATQPTFGVSAAIPALTVTAGTTAINTINVPRNGGFTGAVSLAALNAPGGSTGPGSSTITFTPSPNTGATSTLSIAVPASAVQGSFTITVRGTAAGIADHTTTFSLVVVGLPIPALTVIGNPPAIARGGSATLNVRATGQAGYTLPAVLTLDPISGFSFTGTSQFATLSTVGTISALTLNAAASVAPGIYALTFRLTGSDNTFSLANVIVTVTN